MATINGILYPEYTLFYKDVVANYGAPEALSKIPTITIEGETYNFAELFYERFKHREICAETVQYWKDLANRYIKEAALIFAQKIKQYEELAPKATEREETSEVKTVDNLYLNPTVSAAGTDGRTPKLQSTSEHIYPHHIVFNTKSNATVLDEALDVRNIYFDCLLYCERLFMSIY